MSVLIRYAESRKTDRAALNLGWFAVGSLVLYSGDIPGSSDDALVAQIALAAFDPLPDPAGQAGNGVFALASGTAPATVITTGEPNFARAYDAMGATIADFDVGEEGSEAAVIIDNTSLVEGALVSLLSLAIAEQ